MEKKKVTEKEAMAAFTQKLPETNFIVVPKEVMDAKKDKMDK